MMGGSPTNPTSLPVQAGTLFTDPGTSQTYLRMTCSLREGVAGMTSAAKGSSDLATWSAGPTLVGAISQLNGTTLATWQDGVPISTAPGARRFLRLEISTP